MRSRGEGRFEQYLNGVGIRRLLGEVRPGGSAPPRGCARAALPRSRRPVDGADRRPPRSLPSDDQGVLLRPSDANKGPSWEREAEPGRSRAPESPPAAASRGDVLPRRTLFCARLAVQHAGRLGALMLDRVTERRRAAQLARHYRDQEGLSIAEIARRLGRAEATIKAYLYDPTGDKARAVKARYRGVCRGCGAPTAPRNGKGDAYAYCKRCHPGTIAPQWTRERVREAMRAWRAATALRRRPTTGRAPTHGGAAPRRSNDYRPENGPRRPLSSICTGAGRRPSRTPSRRLSVRASMPLTYERGLALDRL